MSTYFKPGAYSVLCDRTGFKVKNTQAQKEWTGSTVRLQSWERRHPQDLIRSVEDHQDVPDPNPEPEDSFLGTNDVSVDDL